MLTESQLSLLISLAASVIPRGGEYSRFGLDEGVLLKIGNSYPFPEGHLGRKGPNILGTFFEK